MQFHVIEWITLNRTARFFATVAQLVEQLIRNQQVAGSSPASSSKIGKPCRRLADFSMFRNGKSGLHFSPDSCKLAI